MSVPFVPPVSGGCASECPDAVITAVPGPQGPSGTNGTNGTNGANAFTQLAGGFSFNMPAVSATQDLAVLKSTWAAVGQVIFVVTAGWFQVTAIPDGTTITAKNLGYPGNAAPGTLINAPQQVSPSGLQGPAGNDGSGETLNDISPTTSKGDIIADNGANNPNASNVRFGTGGGANDGKILHADNSQPAGLRYDALDLSGLGTVIVNDLPVGNGGTGANTAGAARTNLGLGSLATLNSVDDTNWGANGLTPTHQKTSGAALVGTTPGVDWSTGNSFSQTTTGNTVYAFNNTTDGQSIVIAVSLGGSHTITWPAGVKWKGASGAPSPSGSGKTDLWYFQKIGANYYGAMAADFA